MRSLRSAAVIRIFLAFSLLAVAAAFYRLIQSPLEQGILFASRRWLLTLIAGAGGILILLALFAASWTNAINRLQDVLENLLNRLRRLGMWNLVIFGLAILVFAYLLLGPYGDDYKRDVVRFGLFWIVALAGAFSLRAAGIQARWEVLLFCAGLLGAAIYRAAAFLPEVNNYPFTYSWSEGSRYYYASLFFSKQVYGQAVPLTVLHPTRYLMQGLAFLVPNAPIWFHRLWQIILWWATTSLSAYLLARRLKIEDRLRAIAFGAWTGLFLLIGPVYYYLQVIFIVILVTFSMQRPWRSLFWILVASVWAGISRINWFPMPAMLGIALYLMEKPVGKEPLWRYLVYPLLAGAAGLALAFASQSAYATLSGNPPDQFSSSFSSDLLWYRLLPNVTYPQGVILASLHLALPVLIAALLAMGSRLRHLHWVRGLLLAGMLLVLYAGGLVVSTKIGGGNNLHNMDAFFTLLLLICTYAYFGRIQSEDLVPQEPPALSWKRPLAYVLALTLLIPVYHGITFGGPLSMLEPAQATENLERLSRLIHEITDEGGEVLFLAERQLLTFHLIEGVELIPDYERVFLMEMAMADNRAYLEPFHRALNEKRFDAIVAAPVFINYKDRSEAFGEENNAWVANVAEQILCNYHPNKKLRDISIYIYTPRDQSAERCPVGSP